MNKKNETPSKILLFYIGDDLYACDTAPILEVIPCISRKQELLYGGKQIPLLDFSQIIAQRSSADRLHTRIIIFEEPEFGLIVEKATAVVDILPMEAHVIQPAELFQSVTI